ncbi:hypothetical protein CCUG60885_02443 [Mycobacteroides salmoniphilum]|uniref:Uncharacterized protein n=1 Tax=Mycobacteroides salmoniphilum TaxID=404941 RepID=A0A4R8SHE9_9MYCO|nr:IniB N-terminal domain-containing protein [Mycobacteroides salmoniphilum]TDZ96300.1 hypothetical protein CCUG60885_02443 [Mycobacteroides salmoniphilum]TEA05395.1 hypothetical protein CCUG60883_02700 [Mycobacteroides salmoniphilum]
MSIIDFILNLFRDPVQAASYVADPQTSLANAGLSAVTAAQVGAVMPVVAESVASNYGYQSQWVNTGSPMNDLSGNLQNYYAAQPDAPSILSPSLLSPRDNFSPRNNDFMSHNDTEFASHNPIASGNQVMSPSGNVDSFNRGPLLDLNFGDLQFGNRDTNAIGDGAVAVGGSNSGAIASGKGSTSVNGDVRDSNIVNADHGGKVNLDQSQTRVGGDYTNVSGHGSAGIDKSVTVVDDHSQRNTTNINDSFNTDRSTNIGSGNTTHTDIASHNQVKTQTDIGSHNQTSTSTNTDIASNNKVNTDIASNNQAHTGTSLSNSHTNAINDSLNTSHSASSSAAVSNSHSSAINDSLSSPLNASHSSSMNESFNSSMGSHGAAGTGFEAQAQAQGHASAADHTALPGTEHH